MRPMQFRKFLGHRVLIETPKGEQFLGELTGEDPWFLYLEDVDYTTKENSEHLSAVTIHKKRISLVLDLGEVEASFGGKFSTEGFYDVGARNRL